MTQQTVATAEADAGVASPLVILDPEQTALIKELDGVFTGWATEAGAREICPPPLYRISDLDKFDVYTNFPHLALVAGPLDPARVVDRAPGAGFEAEGLRSVRLGLSHATCYGAYLFYEGATVAPQTLLTLVNRCFRNEDHYSGLRRLMSFQMREIVALGSFDHTQRILECFTRRIEEFASALSVKLEKVPASDPFFQRDGQRALMQKVSPVKYEFQHGDLAIASVNTHRNFFGERCEIRLPDGAFASTSCVAFGLERWLDVLTELHDGDAVSAAESVRTAARAVA
ncbi:hypothetical protein ACFVFQ_11235 [Streptomyces sp. NPDC057743]|uniref:hypothetical protein n=1 Tax=Streptomyces sp. NPDC057743 TaxID=3346236 RepID=UPI0036C07690